MTAPTRSSPSDNSPSLRQALNIALMYWKWTASWIYDQNNSKCSFTNGQEILWKTTKGFSHRLKSKYPRIIVDVISILHSGIDTNGIRVNPIIIEKYYQSRKQQAAMTKEGGLKKSPSMTTSPLSIDYSIWRTRESINGPL